eukprot:s1341_g12.t4
MQGLAPPSNELPLCRTQLLRGAAMLEVFHRWNCVVTSRQLQTQRKTKDRHLAFQATCKHVLPVPSQEWNDGMEEASGRLGGWLKSTKASLEGHVKEIRENSKLIAADVASNVKDLEKASRKIQQTFSIGGNGVLAPGLEEVRLDVTFQQGSLGLNLDLAQGGQILKITPGGQAEALGLRTEDRVVAIGGEPLPSVGDASFQEELKKKLSNLPRPVDMTFVRIEQVERKEKDKEKDKSNKSEVKEKEPKESPELAALQAQLDEALKDAKAARDEGASLAAELKLRKSWAAQETEELEALRSEAEELRAKLQEAGSRNGLETEAELQSKLQTAQQALKDQEAAMAAEGDEKSRQTRSRSAAIDKQVEERAAQSEQVLAQEKSRCSEAVESLTAARSKEEKMEETRQLLERQLAETKASRSEAEEELEETDTLKRRVEELERPGEMSERLSKLQSLCGSQREQLRELELERDALREELQKAEVDLQAAVRQPSEAPAVVYGKETLSGELAGDDPEEASERHQLLEADDDTRRVAKLQARLGELEAKNAALQRSLSQRPIVYQFAPVDAGLDLPEEEPDDEEAQASASTASTAYSLMQGGCRLAMRRCWRLWTLCRKLKCISAAENQLRWFTRRLLEKPFLLWVFYVHVAMLWFIEIWRQALAKPLAMDPALTLESAVTKAHLAAHGT